MEGLPHGDRRHRRRAHAHTAGVPHTVVIIIAAAAGAASQADGASGSALGPACARALLLRLLGRHTSMLCGAYIDLTLACMLPSKRSRPWCASVVSVGAVKGGNMV